jgi:hypothetical protein
MATRRSKSRSSRRSTVRRGPRGSRGPKGSETGIWIGALALAAAAAVGTAVYLTEKKASAAAPPPGVLPAPSPNPNPTPGPAPSALPQTGDVYSALSSAQQAAVNSALYAYVVQGYGGCPQVFQNGMADVTSAGITSAAALSDANTRAAAVDCYQTALNLQPASLGVLDLATYRSLVGV